MTDTELKLPQGWVETTIENIGKIVTGNTPSKKDPSNYGNFLPWVKPPQLDSQTPIENTPEKLSKKGASVARVLEKNSILISCIGDLGKIGIAGTQLSTNQQINSVTCFDGVYYKFVYYFFQNPIFSLWLESNNSATVVKIINKGRFLKAPIILSPLNEQKRIVSKIEELFSKIDSAKQSMEHTKLKLEYYRYSLLKSLTQDKTKDWKIFSLQNIGSWGGGGTPSKRQPEFWKNGIIPWISPKDMIKLEIDDSIDKITKEAIQKSSAKIIKKNSILFVVRSGILRHTLPIALNKIDVSLNQDMKSLTPFDFVNPKYLLFTLFGAREEIRRTCSKDGTTVQSIETSKLLNYELPIPSLPEQEQIVSQIEQGFSLIENTSQIVNSTLQNLQTMKMSVLKQAFEGKLVPQDPNDEPASVLLERIKLKN